MIVINKKDEPIKEGKKFLGIILSHFMSVFTPRPRNSNSSLATFEVHNYLPFYVFYKCFLIHIQKKLKIKLWGFVAYTLKIIENNNNNFRGNACKWFMSQFPFVFYNLTNTVHICFGVIANSYQFPESKFKYSMRQIIDNLVQVFFKVNVYE